MNWLLSYPPGSDYFSLLNPYGYTYGRLVATTPQAASLAAVCSTGYLGLAAWLDARWKTARPQVRTAPSPFNKQVLARCTTLNTPYRPLPFLCYGHVETVAAALLRTNPDVEFRREVVMLEDGGCVCLDWLFSIGTKGFAMIPGGPVLLLLPGLIGGSKESYIRQAAEVAARYGFFPVVYNARGCGGSPVTSARLYGVGGCTDDLRAAIQRIKEQHSDARIFAVGWSLGANLLVKYLGEEGARAPLSAAASLCNPFDLGQVVEQLSQGVNRMYDWHLGSLLRGMFAAHRMMFNGVLDPGDVGWAARASGMESFDRAVTISTMGWKSTDDFYQASSCTDAVPNVAVPLLCLHALDDPVVPQHAIPYTALRANPHCITVTTRCGGHLGWISGSSSPMTKSWSDEAVMEFLQSVSIELDNQTLRDQLGHSQSCSAASDCTADSYTLANPDTDAFCPSPDTHAYRTNTKTSKYCINSINDAYCTNTNMVAQCASANKDACCSHADVHDYCTHTNTHGYCTNPHTHACCTTGSTAWGAAPVDTCWGGGSNNRYARVGDVLQGTRNGLAADGLAENGFVSTFGNTDSGTSFVPESLDQIQRHTHRTGPGLGELMNLAVDSMIHYGGYNAVSYGGFAICPSIQHASTGWVPQDPNAVTHPSRPQPYPSCGNDSNCQQNPKASCCVPPCAFTPPTREEHHAPFEISPLGGGKDPKKLPLELPAAEVCPLSFPSNASDCKLGQDALSSVQQIDGLYYTPRPFGPGDTNTDAQLSDPTALFPDPIPSLPPPPGEDCTMDVTSFSLTTDCTVNASPPPPTDRIVDMAHSPPTTNSVIATPLPLSEPNQKLSSTPNSASSNQPATSNLTVIPTPEPLITFSSPARLALAPAAPICELDLAGPYSTGLELEQLEGLASGPQTPTLLSADTFRRWLGQVRVDDDDSAGTHSNDYPCLNPTSTLHRQYDAQSMQVAGTTNSAHGTQDVRFASALHATHPAHAVHASQVPRVNSDDDVLSTWEEISPPAGAADAACSTQPLHGGCHANGAAHSARSTDLGGTCGNCGGEHGRMGGNSSDDGVGGHAGGNGTGGVNIAGGTGGTRSTGGNSTGGDSVTGGVNPGNQQLHRDDTFRGMDDLTAALSAPESTTAMTAPPGQSATIKLPSSSSSGTIQAAHEHHTLPRTSSSHADSAPSHNHHHTTVPVGVTAHHAGTASTQTHPHATMSRVNHHSSSSSLDLGPGVLSPSAHLQNPHALPDSPPSVPPQDVTPQSFAFEIWPESATAHILQPGEFDCNYVPTRAFPTQTTCPSPGTFVRTFSLHASASGAGFSGTFCLPTSKSCHNLAHTFSFAGDEITPAMVETSNRSLLTDRGNSSSPLGSRGIARSAPASCLSYTHPVSTDAVICVARRVSIDSAVRTVPVARHPTARPLRVSFDSAVYTAPFSFDSPAESPSVQPSAADTAAAGWLDLNDYLADWDQLDQLRPQGSPPARTRFSRVHPAGSATTAHAAPHAPSHVLSHATSHAPSHAPSYALSHVASHPSSHLGLHASPHATSHPASGTNPQGTRRAVPAFDLNTSLPLPTPVDPMALALSLDTLPSPCRPVGTVQPSPTHATHHEAPSSQLSSTAMNHAALLSFHTGNAPVSASSTGSASPRSTAFENTVLPLIPNGTNPFTAARAANANEAAMVDRSTIVNRSTNHRAANVSEAATVPPLVLIPIDQFGSSPPLAVSEQQDGEDQEEGEGGHHSSNSSSRSSSGGMSGFCLAQMENLRFGM